MTFEYALTAIRDGNLDWHEYPQGGFVAIMNGITIRATSSFLIIPKGFKTITIHKPKRPLWKQTTTPLEQLFEKIIKQAVTQCVKHHSNEYQESLKNELLKQLTGLNT